MIVIFPLFPGIISPIVSIVVVLTVVVVVIVVVPVAVLSHELVPKARDRKTGVVRCRSHDELQNANYNKL